MKFLSVTVSRTSMPLLHLAAALSDRSINRASSAEKAGIPRGLDDDGAHGELSHVFGLDDLDAVVALHGVRVPREQRRDVGRCERENAAVAQVLEGGVEIWCRAAEWVHVAGRAAIRGGYSIIDLT